MLKFGDKVLIRDGSALDGVEGVVYRIADEKISVLLDREVIWPVDPDSLERISAPPSAKFPAP
jgi:cation transport regulator ChaC